MDSENPEPLFKLSLDAWLIKCLFVFILAVFNYDLFAIYKSDHKRAHRARYKLYLVPELRIDNNNRDIWRRRWRIVYFAIFILATTKVVGIVIIQAIVYQSDPKLIQLLDSYNLRTIFSNALIDHAGISLLFHMAFLVTSVYAVYFAWYMHSDKPYDSYLMRFTLSPHREIKRIDLIIRERLESALSSSSSLRVARKQQQQQKAIRLTPMRYLNATDSWNICASRELRPRPSSLQVARNNHPLRIDLIILRPIRYQPEYYARAWSELRLIFQVVIALLSMFGFLLAWSILRVIRDIRCSRITQQTGHCTYSQVLNRWTDLESLVECFCTMLAVGAFVTLQIISLITHCLSQLYLIRDTQHHLHDLLKALRLLNERHECGRLSDLSGRFIGEQTRVQHLNDALLKSLVKARVSLDDLCNLNVSLSEQMSSILMLFGSSLILTLTVGRLGAYNIDFLRHNIIRLEWAGINCLLILCAHVFARMVRIEDIVWSIVAQLKMMQYFNLAPPASAPSGSCVDFGDLVTKWDRIARYLMATDVRKSVHPFGINLCFEMVLQMNFFVITIAALWRDQ